MKKIKVKTKEELKKIIKEEIELNGIECDLNHINVSEIEDMSYLFKYSAFKGDISKWDVSNVKDLSYSFYKSAFKGDISDWDVSKVDNMERMFEGAEFNGDISKWDVSKVKTMEGMFAYSKFNCDIKEWKPISLENKKEIFLKSIIEKKGKEPYWSYVPIEKIKETIQNYWLHKELNENLKNINNINSESPRPEGRGFLVGFIH